MSYDNSELEQLSAFLDGRLGPDEAGAVEERLEASDEYRALHDQMASARRVLRSTPAPEVPEGLLAAIQREAAAEMDRGAGVSLWERWRVPIGAVAAAAAVLIAIGAPWQALHRGEVADVPPAPERAAVVADAATDEPAEMTSDADEAEPVLVAEATVDESEAVGSVAATAPPVRRVARERVARPAAPPVQAPVEERVASTEEAEVAVEAAAATEPRLAHAPRPAEVHAATSGPVLSEPRRPSAVRLESRTTIEEKPKFDSGGPSSLEAEMVAGVVAGMVLDQFITEHMLESPAAMLALVTDTPASEFGPRLAGDDHENGSFGFSFTDAMRRALTESEDQVH